MNLKNKWGIALLAGINILMFSLFLVIYSNATFPLVGHDYRGFLPRVIDSYLHYKVNGFSIQWYTPSFGGGLPAYANPLQLQFSLTQLLTWFTDPWKAVLISAIAYALIGFVFTYYFLHNILDLGPLPSILGAVFFIGNGFFIERVVVGHVNFITFPLIIVPVYSLLNPKLPVWLAGAMISLTVSALVYSGGVYIAVIGILVILILLPLIYIIRPAIIKWKNIGVALLLGGVLSFLLCGSKIYPSLLLMQNFPRAVHDEYSVNWITGLGGLIFQLIGAMTTLPFLEIIGKSSLVFVARLREWTGSPFSFWELDSSLSPALIILLMYGTWKALFNKQKLDLRNFKKKAVAGIFLIIAIYMTIEFSIAKGAIFTELSKLLILKSLHVNTRYTSAFILPLAILGAKVFNEWSERGKTPKKIFLVFGILDIIALATLWGYYLLPMDVQQRFFDIRSITETYRRISAGETFPVNTIVPDMNDYEVFVLEASNITRHYEPLFRDHNGAFHPLVHAGSVFEINNGYFNFTDPTGYVFPEINGTRIYERIPISDRDKLDDFINRRQPDWKLPIIQIFLDWAAGITCGMLFCAILLYLSVKYIRIKNSQFR
jgi:hypothetical protein